MRFLALILAAALAGAGACRDKPEPKPAPMLVSSGSALGVLTLSELPEPEEEIIPLAGAAKRKDPPSRQSSSRGAPPLAARLVIPEKPASRVHDWEKREELPRGELEQGQRQGKEDNARPDGHRMRAELGYGYLSPAAVKGPGAGQENVAGGTGLGYGQAPQAAASTGAVSVTVEAPVIDDFDAKARDEMLQAPESGSYRVQVSHSPEFQSVLFEKVYIFEEEMLILPDLRAYGLPSGIYWIRVAFIDLLDFQQPFSSPKRFRLRNAK